MQHLWKRISWIHYSYENLHVIVFRSTAAILNQPQQQRQQHTAITLFNHRALAKQEQYIIVPVWEQQHPSHAFSYQWLLNAMW